MTSWKNTVSEWGRRAMDLFGAGLGIILLSPLWIIVAIAIKLDSPGPVFYRARRVGKNGEEFCLYKFRTMVTDADKLGPAITAAGDTRITRVGGFLRRTKIDELPQLINVMKGEMGLVGPRPEDPRYVALYTSEQREILQVRPGITSAASLTYRNEEKLLQGEQWEEIYQTEVLPAKLAIDLEYLRNRTLWSDLVLIVKTVWSMFQ